ncbi:unnamed protein product, partial [Clonostachys byssicola]
MRMKSHQASSNKNKTTFCILDLDRILFSVTKNNSVLVNDLWTYTVLEARLRASINQTRALTVGANWFITLRGIPYRTTEDGQIYGYSSYSRHEGSVGSGASRRAPTSGRNLAQDDLEQPCGGEHRSKYASRLAKGRLLEHHLCISRYGGNYIEHENILGEIIREARKGRGVATPVLTVLYEITTALQWRTRKNKGHI